MYRIRLHGRGGQGIQTGARILASALFAEGFETQDSPLYGAGDGTFFLGVHCFNTYIKLAFFRGVSLDPVPPVASKDENTRYFHILEDPLPDEQQLADWIRQAAALPGWMV